MRKPLDVAPWIPPIAAEIMARTKAMNSQYPPVVTMLSIRYGLTAEISVAPETVLPRINVVVSIAEKIDIPNVTRPAYMPMLREFAPVSLPASFPAK